jgi:competence protein ComEA
MMSPRLEGALARGAARAMGSRFAKPIARIVLVALGLVLLAAIGRAGSAGAFGGSPAAALLVADASLDPGLAAAPPVVAPAPAPTPPQVPAPHPHGSASPEDPVILNTAAVDDLQRLPGIGQKRADAIMALRARLGRFHAIEDLLKVRGVGRATLKRLRPLVRLDAPPMPSADGGAPPAVKG